MKKISKSNLDKIRKQKGARVEEPEAPAVEATPEPEIQTEEVPHASMAASMAQSQAQHEATQQLIARNTEVVAAFAKDVKAMTSREPAATVSEGRTSPWDQGGTFDVVRDSKDRLKRIYARPGILED